MCYEYVFVQKAFTSPVFKTESVSSEFIVKFAGFYVEPARRKYIEVALKSFGGDNFEIVARNNPMAAYPSDFDVIVSPNKPTTVPGCAMMDTIDPI